MSIVKPYVTTMIVTYNESSYIKESLTSLLNQEYPVDRFEIILVDGRSKDDTVKVEKEVVAKYYSEHDIKLPKVRYIINEKQLLASGWNLGIKAAEGQYVTRIDAHGYAAPDFLKKSVEVTERVSDAVCVGGLAKTIAKTGRGKLISKILSSPFGVGDAKFRYSSEPSYVDTVGHGLYQKSIFENVGYFNEELARNQDNDMHKRIRAAGYKFFYDPQIHSFYYPRETITGLYKQGFQNGKWSFYLIKCGQSAVSIRHCIPFAFVVCLWILLILGIISVKFIYLLSVVLVLYFTFAVFFSIKIAKTIKELFVLPVLFFGYHFIYGTGSIVGLFTKKGNRL